MSTSEYLELPRWFVVQVSGDSTIRIFATKILDNGTIIGTKPNSSGSLMIIKNYEVAMEE